MHNFNLSGEDFENRLKKYNQQSEWDIKLSPDQKSVFASRSISRANQFGSIIAYGLLCFFTGGKYEPARTELDNARNQIKVVQLKLKEGDAPVSTIYNRVMGTGNSNIPSGKTNLPSSSKPLQATQTPQTDPMQAKPEIEKPAVSDDQIKELIDSENFDALYDLMPSFEPHQWRLFKLPHLKKIFHSQNEKIANAPDKQTKELLVEQKKAIFKNIYRRMNSEKEINELLLNLNGNDLTVLLPLFGVSDCYILNKEQINAIDFEKAVVDEETFQKLFGDPFNLPSLNASSSRSVQRLQDLTGNHLTILLWRFPKFFSKNHTDKLTLKQISGIDFTRAGIDKNMFKQIFVNGDVSFSQRPPDGRTDYSFNPDRY